MPFFFVCGASGDGLLLQVRVSGLHWVASSLPFLMLDGLHFVASAFPPVLRPPPPRYIVDASQLGRLIAITAAANALATELRADKC